MQLELNLEQLRDKKIFIATPMYGGQCHGAYTKSIADFMTMCTKYGVDAKLFFIFNESLITRARNYCADEFLRSGYDYLVFIDSDIHFEPQDVLVMAHFAINNPEMEVVCGPYPKKCISWEKIKKAVDRGFADKDPQQLEKYVGDYVFNPTDGQESIALNEPVEVLEGGTGFMIIQRGVFEKFKAAYPHLSYKPDHVRTEHFDGSREIHAYFDCVIDPKTKRYLSEDYMFCQYARDAGMKVWLCPWMKLEHQGTYVFGGSLVDLANLGVTATADVSMLKKKKKK